MREKEQEKMKVKRREKNLGSDQVEQKKLESRLASTRRSKH